MTQQARKIPSNGSGNGINLVPTFLARMSGVLFRSRNHWSETPVQLVKPGISRKKSDYPAQPVLLVLFPMIAAALRAQRGSKSRARPSCFGAGGSIQPNACFKLSASELKSTWYNGNNHMASFSSYGYGYIMSHDYNNK